MDGLPTVALDEPNEIRDFTDGSCLAGIDGVQLHICFSLCLLACVAEPIEVDEQDEAPDESSEEQTIGACSNSFQCTQCTCTNACSTPCCAGIQTTCGVAGPIGAKCTGDATCNKTYCARAVVTSAALHDIREGGGGFGSNGPLGFAFFGTKNGAPKYGRGPRAIGGISYPTNVYASNLQGPILVDVGYMKQYEWTANGSQQVSTRTYPLEFAKECATSPTGLTLRSSQVWEDDDGPYNDDDYLGAVSISNRVCDTVFGRGLTSGWTAIYQSGASSYLDYVRYRVWCYKCPSGTGDCKTQVWY